jgi:heat shock protein HtpX
MRFSTAAPLIDVRRRQHKLRNIAQSAILLGGMAGLVCLCAWTLVGLDGLVWILFGAVIGLIMTPKVSPRLVLAFYRGRELGPHQFPEGVRILQMLAARADLPCVPRIYYIPSAMLNAFAVGNRTNAVIAVTDGLLRAMSLRELAGVFAHELSHIRNNDLWIMSLADSISRLTVFMSYVGVLLLFLGLPIMLIGGGSFPWLLVPVLIFSPTIASLLQLALSRAREFDADLDAAGLTGDPIGLASALEKLERGGGLWEQLLLPGRRAPEPSLLRSHPTTEERTRRLLELRPPARALDLQSAEPFALPGSMVRVRRRPRYHITGTWY